MYPNRQRDYSFRPPQIPLSQILSFQNTPEIEFVLLPGGIVTAYLQANGVTPGTYGSATQIPVFTVDQDGRITSITQVPASGGGSPYTVNNGLTESPPNNFQLGGTLVQSTVLTAGAFATPGNRLRFDALSLDTVGGFYFTALTSPSYTVNDILSQFWSIGATSLKVISDNLYGGLSSYGLWLEARNAGATGLYLETKDLSAIPLHARNSVAGYNLMFLRSNGELELPRYGTGIFAGTPAYALGVDASGNVVEFTPGGGSGTVTSVGLSMPAPVNPAFSVSGSPVTTNGTLTVTANGNTSQIILGDGSLASISQVVVAARVYQEDTYVSNTQQTSVEYVASVGKVYVTNQSSTNVTIYDATNGDLLATIAGITNALKVKYISSINEVWVTSSTATTIWRIDASANTLIGTITTGVTANGWNILEYSASKVFIACTNNPGSIMVLDPSVPSVTTTITTNVPVNPLGMALNTNSSSLQFDKIVVCASPGVAILDPNTNTITTTVVNPGSAFNVGRYIQYSAADDKYYAASQINGRIICLSIATATTFTATFIPNNLFLMDCAVDDANDLLFSFPMEGGATESILVKVYKKSTLTPIIAFKTSCLGGTSSQSAFHAIDLLNKRLFVVGRNSQANGAISVIRYL